MSGDIDEDEAQELLDILDDVCGGMNETQNFTSHNSSHAFLSDVERAVHGVVGATFSQNPDQQNFTYDGETVRVRAAWRQPGQN